MCVCVCLCVYVCVVILVICDSKSVNILIYLESYLCEKYPTKGCRSLENLHLIPLSLNKIDFIS